HAGGGGYGRGHGRPRSAGGSYGTGGSYAGGGRGAGGRGGGGRHGGNGGGRGDGNGGGNGHGGGRRGRRYAAQKDGKRGWRKLFTWKAFGLCALGMFLLGVIGVGIAYALTPIPDANEFARSQATIVYWNDGETELHRFSAENRELVNRIDEIPLHVRQAVLAAEDRTFYEHSGFDPVGISRAVVNNLSGGTGGGSTVTQQYVKNYYLTTERTLTRKMKELFISIKIDQRFSKDQILLDYLNTIWWGRGSIHGVQ